MSESNNVKFVENNGKWMWKRYDEQGSVIFRSPEFETERQAREDYEVNGGTPTANETASAEVNTQEAESAPENAPEPENTTAESESASV